MAPGNNDLDCFTGLRLAPILQRPRAGALSMSAEEVREMATLGGARALGLEAEIGSLEAGKRADHAVLDLNRPHCLPAAGDPVAQVGYCAHASGVEPVIADGRVVVEGRRFLTLDEGEVVARARE